jgi:hypothetical protein
VLVTVERLIRPSGLNGLAPGRPAGASGPTIGAAAALPANASIEMNAIAHELARRYPRRTVFLPR